VHYPSIILAVAERFPTTLPRLRKTLEILL
jgi:hypothetical protein